MHPATHSAEEVIAALNLEPLDQEGGFFRRTVQSENFAEFGGAWGRRRSFAAIYALFTRDMFSAMHRLVTDEAWFFHVGDPLETLVLAADGSGRWLRQGLNLAGGEQPQNRVPAQTWQGTRLVAGGRWALVSTMMAPEFVWGDFELAECPALQAQYPAWADEIRSLTRDEPPKGAL